ncbi:aspartate aminotransferase family protein [bacterium]|nr:aspartate aminotransferase family protein [bacterium]
MRTESFGNNLINDDLAANLVPGGSMGLPVITAGSGAEVLDEDGNKYLDLEAGPGVASVGHCHPTVVAAVQEQAAKLMQSPGRYHSRLTSELAKRITDLTGNRLRRVFFSNSGAEANDGAIKLALKRATLTGKRGFGILALEHGFHGRLSLPLSLTGMASRKKGFGPYGSFPGVVHVPAPYCYRCPLGLSLQNCGVKCADVVEDVLKTRVPGEAAALIAEPILGVGGVIVPPESYWPKVETICRGNNILLIHDEVFCGFGRTGKMFGHQHWDSKPDIVTFAKTIGGGLPLGGFMATEEVGTSFEEGDHFTTFGGNSQVGPAAAHAVLDVLEKEHLVKRAVDAGHLFMHGLKGLAAKHEAIGDVRGRGLMIGVELVKDRASREPAPQLTKQLQQAMRERGVLVAITGVHGCVLRITPPLVISEAQVTVALDALDAALTAAAQK